MRIDPLKMEKMSQKALERKNNKPVMEKKRRARINHCLNQLKALILETDSERSRHSKLEKADILEMTVRYLQTLRAYHLHIQQLHQLQQQQHQQSTSPAATSVPARLAPPTHLSLNQHLHHFQAQQLQQSQHQHPHHQLQLQLPLQLSAMQQQSAHPQVSPAWRPW